MRAKKKDSRPSGRPAMDKDAVIKSMPSKDVKLSDFILSSIPEAYFLLDEEGGILDCNKMAEEMTGYEKKELVGKKLSKVGMNALSDFGEALKKRLSGSGVIKGDTRREIREMVEPDEMPFVTKSGENRVFQTSSVKMTLGKVGYTIVLARDVTEQSKKIDNLITSEKMYRRVFEISPDSIVICDLKGTIVFVNQTFCKFTGYPKEDVIGRFWPTIPTIRSIDMSTYIKNFKNFLTGAGSTNQEFVWRNKAGETRWGEAHIGLLDVENETNFLVILRDITKRKAADEAIAKSELRNKTIVENLVDGLFIHDLRGEIIEVNLAAKKMCGFKESDEMMGKFISSFEADRTKRLMDASLKKAESLGSWSLDGEFVDKDGKKIPVSIRSKLVSTTGSGIVQTLVRDMDGCMNA
jgi:PAS domain S-box-containing protein